MTEYHLKVASVDAEGVGHIHSVIAGARDIDEAVYMALVARPNAVRVMHRGEVVWDRATAELDRDELYCAADRLVTAIETLPEGTLFTPRPEWDACDEVYCWLDTSDDADELRGWLDRVESHLPGATAEARRLFALGIPDWWFGGCPACGSSGRAHPASWEGCQ